MVLILFLIGMVGIIAAFLLQILKISSTRRKNNIIVMILGVLGFANMWLAIFADVGVSLLAVLNASRILALKKL